ncbi:hypothetical protein CC85DRAFT_299754 [Cutaneotrichosporon oleaginosum]|uniref:Uncharacterized protein n=1 Tax=Cutaneotrichosporon oleaginosum TaxID=879819 RepID=A0A0J1BBC6_9TREE|nr:uncharacterized protein CC85DRAFT_299754 [Cutaneotrichosporon oleaginosum]KLT45294.1 hypothetical protein CC85DRAFT_299754 [Cutaneotrichosporon oleaginosum]TXT14877.1 hypothetical protein COLE_01070 [Cutaneotrichosporon oleaginosum]
MQSAQAETLPPITAITDAYYPSSALEHQGAYGGNSQAEGSGHAAFNLRQSSQQHGYHSDSYQSQNVPQTHHSQSQQQTHHQHDQPQSSQQQPSHRPQHHQHDQSPSSQQQSSHRPHNVHTLTQQSAYPPTGPATFPSPTLSAASVPDPVNASMSTHSVLRSPTSQTRSSLLEAPQQSFSQLRMFAQKFETDFGSGSATSQQTSQKQHGQHHDGPRKILRNRADVWGIARVAHSTEN